MRRIVDRWIELLKYQDQLIQEQKRLEISDFVLWMSSYEGFDSGLLEVACHRLPDDIHYILNDKIAYKLSFEYFQEWKKRTEKRNSFNPELLWTDPYSNSQELQQYKEFLAVFFFRSSQEYKEFVSELLKLENHNHHLRYLLNSQGYYSQEQREFLVKALAIFNNEETNSGRH
jgi:hypothetical protein